VEDANGSAWNYSWTALIVYDKNLVGRTVRPFHPVLSPAG